MTYRAATKEDRQPCQKEYQEYKVGGHDSIAYIRKQLQYVSVILLITTACIITPQDTLKSTAGLSKMNVYCIIIQCDVVVFWFSPQGIKEQLSQLANEINRNTHLQNTL